MSGVVLDASAILAFVQDEEGADTVEAELLAGACCGSANWSEVAQKVLAADRDWGLVRSLLMSYAVAIEPVPYRSLVASHGRPVVGKAVT